MPGKPKYGDDKKQYVIDNAGKMSVAQFAVWLGVSVDAFWKIYRRWNRDGLMPSLRYDHHEIGAKIKRPAGHWEIKTENGWERLNRYTYRTLVGEIPEGYQVILLDGNYDNCEDPKNLILLNNDQKLVRMQGLAKHKQDSFKEKTKLPGGRTSHKKKAGTDANWTQKHLQAVTKMVIPPPPTGNGIKIDSRTTVYPKNPNATAAELQNKFCKPKIER